MAFVGQSQSIVTSSDDFGDLVRNNNLLVDKTLMIKDFLRGEKVSLITRPRRFGKTINLSMLQYFLSAEVAGKSTAGLFENLAIAKEEEGNFIKKHQGQYPVIFITLKDLKEPSFKASINKINVLVQRLYEEHKHCLKFQHLDKNDRVKFEKYLQGFVNQEELEEAIAFLSQFLYKAYHKKNVMILIDEYDSPLTNAYQQQKNEPDFLELLSGFMRNMLSSALKTNAFLEKALMTGILRVSKSSMLSGLNNLSVYTLLNTQYNQYFGFTEEEVKELLNYTKNNVNLSDIQSFYNGYKIGGITIYNPWSFMKFLSNKELDYYWVQTSNDKLLQEIFLKSSDETKKQLIELMKGNSITGEIKINLNYVDLISRTDALWTLLLFCGYLTIEQQELNFSEVQCELKIPNTEILAQYRRIFVDWLKEKLGTENYTSLLSSLITGNVEIFTASLSDYLMDSLSFYDVHGKKSEKFYHGFVAGLIAGIRDTHWVDSNKESGKGRYDLIFIPKNSQYDLGIIIEFKKTNNMEELENQAKVAIAQIDTKLYNAVLKRYTHIRRLLKIGLAFCDKAVLSVYQYEDLLTHKSDALALSQIIRQENDEQW